MNNELALVAKACLDGAEDGTMAFPQIVERLFAAGFEGYSIDYRRATATYFLRDDESVELPTHRVEGTTAPALDAAALRARRRQYQDCGAP